MMSRPGRAAKNGAKDLLCSFLYLYLSSES